MPIHRLPRATMHEDVAAIEHDGERIASVTADGEFVIVATVYAGDTVTQRLTALTHQTRLGGAA